MLKITFRKDYDSMHLTGCQDWLECANRLAGMCAGCAVSVVSRLIGMKIVKRFVVALSYHFF
jgi:hypothetical protein